ncbi:MAG: collagen-like protein [Winogradskyella sp.]|uniref:collagen-like triple helix repeat-containing protein n=1 Tax=Winogradskyella sp. TaxID=1883156 RepID=UPI00385D557E
MRHILSFITVFALLFTSCTGPQGPPGFDGLQGPPGFDGETFIGSAFEIVIDFNADNNFEFFEPYGFEVFPSDVTLVYIEWDLDNGESIWRLLPQTVYFDNGSVLVYNFDFTQQDVRFFLDGTANFNTLDPVWTQSQAFRVVVLPADNVDGIDITDYNAVSNANNLETFDIR